MTTQTLRPVGKMLLNTVSLFDTRAPVQHGGPGKPADMSRVSREIQLQTWRRLYVNAGARAISWKRLEQTPPPPTPLLYTPYRADVCGVSRHVYNIYTTRVVPRVVI